MMKEITEYVVYEGNFFQVEWYYSENGKSQACDYYKKLNASERRKVLRLFQVMGDIGKIHNEQRFRNEGDKIYAFKPQPHRFLSFFFDGGKIIITNAFVKKQQKLPEAEKKEH